MNENKRLNVILFVITVFAIILGVSSYNSYKLQKEILGKFEKTLNSKEEKVVFLERPTCSYCQMTSPIIESLSKRYDFKYLDINTDELKASNLSKILKKLGIDSENFGTPHIAIVKEGKVVAEQAGYVEAADMFNLFQTNGVIDKKAEYKEILNYVDYKEYKSLISSKKPKLVVMVQTGCGACNSAKPVLEELVMENDIKINALNITNLSEEDRNSLGETLDYLSEEEWGTPLLLLVKENEVLDAVNGFLDKDTYEIFLKRNGLID